jgi:hypothetical protein
MTSLELRNSGPALAEQAEEHFALRHDLLPDYFTDRLTTIGLPRDADLIVRRVFFAFRFSGSLLFPD